MPARWSADDGARASAALACGIWRSSLVVASSCWCRSTGCSRPRSPTRTSTPIRRALLPSNPHLFNFVDVWYLDPVPALSPEQPDRLGDRVAGNVVFNAMAGYALTKQLPRASARSCCCSSRCMLIPFQATIIPAYLITAKLGLLNTYLGLAFPHALDHHLHLRVQGGVRGGPALADRCRAHRRPDANGASSCAC